MIYGLSTGHEIGLATTGAIFITFALLSSFVFPRINPNFPGKKGLLWYIPLCVVFFVAMMSAVIVFGREEKVAEAAPPGSSAPAGNVAAGKTVFMTAGCAACHTFTPAAAKGTIGPNLDMLKTYANKAGQPLEDFTIAAITKPPPKYVPPGFPTNVMPGTFGKSLTQQQLADLVAFLESGPG